VLNDPAHRNNPAFKARRNTSFKLSFPTMPSLKRTPRKVELRQVQNHHDILIISFPITGKVWFDEIPTGLPVQFSWAQENNSATWYGYVSSVSKLVAQSQREQTMEVQCIGASFPLKERANRVFSDSTIPEAVETIAKQHGLAFVGDQHPRRFPQLTMAGHSYWEWIQEQAKRIGFAVVMHNTTLYFRDLDSYINQKITQVPLLYAGNTPSQYRGQLHDRTLDSFEVIKGDLIEQGVTRRSEKTVGGVDPLTGRANTSTASPKDVGDSLRTTANDVLFSEYRTDQVVSSYTDSVQMSKGAAQMGRFKLPAKVKCQGDPRIHPYGTVQILGTGEKTDGYWLVKDVTHIFQKFGDYNITMTVVTDGTGQNEKTAFRGTQNLFTSILNIPELVSRPSSLAQSAQNITTRLIQTVPPTVSSQQGFNQTPTRWKATT